MDELLNFEGEDLTESEDESRYSHEEAEDASSVFEKVDDLYSRANQAAFQSGKRNKPTYSDILIKELQVIHDRIEHDLPDHPDERHEEEYDVWIANLEALENDIEFLKTANTNLKRAERTGVEHSIDTYKKKVDEVLLNIRTRSMLGWLLSHADEMPSGQHSADSTTDEESEEWKPQGQQAKLGFRPDHHGYTMAPMHHSAAGMFQIIKHYMKEQFHGHWYTAADGDEKNAINLVNVIINEVPEFKNLKFELKTPVVTPVLQAIVDTLSGWHQDWGSFLPQQQQFRNKAWEGFPAKFYGKEVHAHQQWLNTLLKSNTFRGMMKMREGELFDFEGGYVHTDAKGRKHMQKRNVEQDNEDEKQAEVPADETKTKTKQKISDREKEIALREKEPWRLAKAGAKDRIGQYMIAERKKAYAKVRDDIELKYKQDATGRDVSWIDIVKQIWASISNELQGSAFTQERANQVVEQNFFNLWYQEYGKRREHVSPAILFGDKRRAGKEKKASKNYFRFNTTHQTKLWGWISKATYKRGKQFDYVTALVNAFQDRPAYERFVEKHRGDIQVKKEPVEDMRYDAVKEFETVFQEGRNYWTNMATNEFTQPVQEAMERNKFGIPLMEHLIEKYKQFLTGENMKPLIDVLFTERKMNWEAIKQRYDKRSILRANKIAAGAVLHVIDNYIKTVYADIKLRYWKNPLSSQAIDQFKKKRWVGEDGMTKMFKWLSNEVANISKERHQSDKKNRAIEFLFRPLTQGSIEWEVFKKKRKVQIEDQRDRTFEAIEELDKQMEDIKKDKTIIHPGHLLYAQGQIRDNLFNRWQKLEDILIRKKVEKQMKDAKSVAAKQAAIDLTAATPAKPAVQPPARPAAPHIPARQPPAPHTPARQPPAPHTPARPARAPVPRQPAGRPAPPQRQAVVTPRPRAPPPLPGTALFLPPRNVNLPAFGMAPNQFFRNPVVAPARQPHQQQNVVNRQAHPASPQEQKDEEKAWDDFMLNEGGRVLRTDYTYNRARRQIRPKLKYYKTKQHYRIPNDQHYIVGGDQVKEVAYVRGHRIPEHAPEENIHKLFIKALKEAPVYRASKKITDIGDNIRVSLFNHSIHFYFSGLPAQRALQIMAERIVEQAASTRDCRLLVTQMVKGRRNMRTIISKRDLQHTPRIAIQNMLARSRAKHFILRFEGAGGSIHSRYENKLHLL